MLRLQPLTLLLLLFLSLPALANRFANVEINATPLADNLYMLTGSGGNMAALVTDNEVILIDAQYAELADKINAKLTELSSGKALGTLINTHMHGDHVNGNSALMPKRIIAHANVLKRLSADAAFPRAGLPTETFTKQLSLNMNGQQLRLEYLPPSHTDGDIIVWFEGKNVVHMGDMLFEGRFPFIDLNNGGSVRGYIANVAYVINQIDDKTKVVPGHGELTDKAGLQRFHQMMLATLAQVEQQQAKGLSNEQIVAAGLGEQWKNWHWNFITEERWINTLLQAEPLTR
ncbi:MAG: Zn-dependent hydrolase [Rheinheimera sp.]|uniref:MBL fold metallo-hydrolase n=1 Tax=Arsukibacterium sp. UBA3155 TaxID=1946058 RepID=UPI000C8B3E46|nr:MBL fold metallo-hydrolase [Arsukibacterium sp. UBA3155]MAD74204.1 Zn-dependent hydrolase [Rheinheimera sp.]|tara:strand:+ start:120072 stop:120935 length:864 start_codon:yes stop_codon:yes gene_type:complete